MAHSPLDKIQALDAIEKEIITCVQSAGMLTFKDSRSLPKRIKMHASYNCVSCLGQSLQELGKEKTSQKAVENNTQQFLKSLNIIESKLSEQLNYLTQVSTGQPHEGSGYASAKVLQMAWHRIQHARSRVRELDESKSKYVQLAARHQRQVGATAVMPPIVATAAGGTTTTTTTTTPTTAMTMAAGATAMATAARPSPSPSQTAPPNLAPLSTTAAPENAPTPTNASVPPTTSS